MLHYHLKRRFAYSLGMACIVASCLTTAHAEWSVHDFLSENGYTRQVGVTGQSADWQQQQAHPRLRLACSVSQSGGELRLGFHFPAGHPFLEQSSVNEPVMLVVNGVRPTHDTSLNLMYLLRSENSVFYTTLASEGLAMSRDTGALILDLINGEQLRVKFMHGREGYIVGYDLAGLSASVADTLQTCQMQGLSHTNLAANWEDRQNILARDENATQTAPTLGAAAPTTAPSD